ncbi:DUF1659 domain-containing protein [Oceanobacillus neutriphilus]|uniref:DUF1659 domain-containing protein n=1 Tax=Oceanobacillus neutriphilus TaxID=531815 RepID=A0ABQ2P369_9BACI|nr:DUF1659 domain-containing protein [Oceanobacillus neutriphilus]GGP16861.1 hypothetical protein GCM10011346_50510 [Oceanobacillus neutriphilus]
MAVAELKETVLQLTLNEGFDPISGEFILKQKRFNNVKPDVTADQLFNTANAFISVQQNELYSVNRRDVLDIHEEEA